MICSACGVPPSVESAGVWVIPVFVSRGPKSGQPVPYEDCFPDGQERKFVCWECILSHLPELAESLGLFGVGYDAPDMSSVQETNTGSSYPCPPSG